MKMDLKTIPIVFTKHARERASGIGKTLYFITEKIRASRVEDKTWGEKIYIEKAYGNAFSCTYLKNGDYGFVTEVVTDSPKYLGEQALLVITVVNLNIRKSVQDV